MSENLTKMAQKTSGHSSSLQTHKKLVAFSLSKAIVLQLREFCCWSFWLKDDRLNGLHMVCTKIVCVQHFNWSHDAVIADACRQYFIYVCLILSFPWIPRMQNQQIYSFWILKDILFHVFNIDCNFLAHFVSKGKGKGKVNRIQQLATSLTATKT